jgi:plastocyanin
MGMIVKQARTPQSRGTVAQTLAGAVAVALGLAVAVGAVVPTSAAAEIEATVSIKDHKFDPAEIRVPAGQAIKLTVKNMDATPEEFESKALKVEKVIPGNSTQVLRLKALKKGSYPFVGEYNESTAKGVLIAE